MSKTLRVLTQNLFGVPVGPPFRTEFQLYHVHRLSRFRKFIEWVEQKQNPSGYGSVEKQKNETEKESDENIHSSSSSSSFVGSGGFDVIALQEVFKWRTGPFSRFLLMPLWRQLSTSSICLSPASRYAKIIILVHWICMVFSFIDGMFWGWLGCVWDDQSFIIELAKKKLGLNFAATPKLPPIRYLWHFLIWFLAFSLAAPIVFSSIFLGKSQALIAAGLVLLFVLLIVAISVCFLRSKIVTHLSSRTEVSPFIIDSGLVLLCREPPADRGRFVFDYVAGSGLEGFFCQKGAIWLDVKIGEDNLRVMNTHLQSDADGTCRLKPSAVRELQFQQLRADIFKMKRKPRKRRDQDHLAKKPDAPLLLMGDLNILRLKSDEEYKAAMSIMGLKGLESQRLITHRITQQHFDHIWMTADRVSSARVQAHYGHGSFGFVSDHNGVEAVIVCK